MHPKWIQIKHTLNEECIKCKILRKYFQKLKDFLTKMGTIPTLINEVLDCMVK